MSRESVVIPEEEVSFPDMGCFGCSPTNQGGLRLKFYKRGNEVLSRYSVPLEKCGAPRIAHGGVLATIVDEVSCAAVVFLEGTHVVTGELTVRYLRPCPAEQEIEIVARVQERREKYLIVQSEIRHGSETLARGTGRFFPVSRHTVVQRSTSG